LSIGRSFHLFLHFSSLLHTLLLLWISAQYKWRRHGFLPHPGHSRVEGEFPRVPDPPKGYRTVPNGRGTFEFVRVRTRHDCLMLSFPFLSLIRLMQPRRSGPTEGDYVTVARDPGRVTAILYSRLATSLRSLAIILPIYIYTYYQSHPRLQPYSYDYHTYTYEAERRHMCPYRYES
jgi:hypothetical protein